MLTLALCLTVEWKERLAVVDTAEESRFNMVINYFKSKLNLSK